MFINHSEKYEKPFQVVGIRPSLVLKWLWGEKKTDFFFLMLKRSFFFIFKQKFVFVFGNKPNFH